MKKPGKVRIDVDVSLGRSLLQDDVLGELQGTICQIAPRWAAGLRICEPDTPVKAKGVKAKGVKAKGVRSQNAAGARRAGVGARQIHDELDAAVAEAYGLPADLSDDEILRRLVALNAERAEEESRGIVRWLRPEFQNPAGSTTPPRHARPSRRNQARQAQAGGEAALPQAPRRAGLAPSARS